MLSSLSGGPSNTFFVVKPIITRPGKQKRLRGVAPSEMASDGKQDGTTPDARPPPVPAGHPQTRSLLAIISEINADDSMAADASAAPSGPVELTGRTLSDDEREEEAEAERQRVVRERAEMGAAGETDSLIAELGQLETQMQGPTSAPFPAASRPSSHPNLSVFQTPALPDPTHIGQSLAPASSARPSLPPAAPRPRRKRSLASILGDDADDIKAAAGRRRRGRKRRRGDRTKRKTRLSDEAYTLWLQANTAFADAQSAKAVDFCQKAIAASPAAHEPYRTLGLIYKSSGQLKKALEAKKMAAELHSKDLDLWREIADLHVNFGDYKSALYAHSRVLRFNNKDLDSLNARAELFRSLQMPTPAIQAYERILRYGGETCRCDPSFLQPLAVLYYKQNKPAKVKKILSTYVDIVEKNIKSASAGRSAPRESWQGSINTNLVNMLLEVLLDNGEFKDAALLVERVLGLRNTERTENVQNSAFGPKSESISTLPIDIQVRYGIALLRTHPIPAWPQACFAAVFAVDLGASNAFQDLFLEVAKACSATNRWGRATVAYVRALQSVFDPGLGESSLGSGVGADVVHSTPIPLPLPLPTPLPAPLPTPGILPTPLPQHGVPGDVRAPALDLSLPLARCYLEISKKIPEEKGAKSQVSVALHGCDGLRRVSRREAFEEAQRLAGGVLAADETNKEAMRLLADALEMDPDKQAKAAELRDRLRVAKDRSKQSSSTSYRTRSSPKSSSRPAPRDRGGAIVYPPRFQNGPQNATEGRAAYLRMNFALAAEKLKPGVEAILEVAARDGSASGSSPLSALQAAGSSSAYDKRVLAGASGSDFHDLLDITLRALAHAGRRADVLRVVQLYLRTRHNMTKSQNRRWKGDAAQRRAVATAAVLSCQYGEYESAYELARRDSSLGEHSVPLILRAARGLCYPNKCIKYLQRLEKNDTTPAVSAAAASALGHIHMQKRSYAAAVACYERALGVAQWSRTLHLCRASAVLHQSMATGGGLRHALVLRGMAGLFEDLKGERQGTAEALHAAYNVGRGFHYLGLCYMALEFYRKILRAEVRARRDGTERPHPALVRHAAHNSAVILQDSGNWMQARQLQLKFIRV